MMREPKPRKSGVVVPSPPKWHGRAAAAAIFGVLRALSWSATFRWDDRSKVFEGDNPEPVIFALWHNRLAFSIAAYRLHVLRRQPTRKLAALVSASKDGAMLALTLEHFGVQPVRGSSSRRGPQALLELTSWAERGYDLAITPDGPRGPAYVVQEGVLALAQVTGLPIVPASYRLDWKYRAKSWDRFQIPLPFATCDVVVGEPLRVPRDTPSEDRERLRLELENRMKKLTVDD
jgi:lysophospholipid acyltransferase (LPLAT)-like uncharacterized protein